MFETLINQTGISLERLAMLCEIAESGSIGAATAGNANRQSQFSRQLAELETFFGSELLDRRARPFRLNEAGRELAQLARMSLAGLEDFLARSKGARTRLVVGAGESLIQWLLLPAAIQAKPG
ncbi:MAG: LysR family transcriptional regulator, partial [Verrucomicrobiaceae bacterium]